MKPLFFISILILVISIFSCQKELLDPGKAIVIVDSINNITSNKIKVWHGVRTPGKAPKPTIGSSAPVIAAPSDTFLHGFAGRYAIIKPEVRSGTVAGYYISIKGASDYFKVDYSKPLITERVIGKRVSQPLKHTGIGFRPSSTLGDGFVDSSIVLILPPNIQTPDTFCVTYSAYDASGNVSDSVSSCIIISKLGGDANSGWLQAGWRLFYNYDDSLKNNDTVKAHYYDTIPYNKWVDFNNYGSIYYDVVYHDSYFCNTISPGVTQVSSNFIDNTVSKYIANYDDSIIYLKMDLIFNKNGGLSISESYNENRIDTINSTCDAIKYITNTDDGLKLNGAWSITGDKLIEAFEFNEDGRFYYNFYEYPLIKINDNEFWMMDYSDPRHKRYIDYRKL